MPLTTTTGQGHDTSRQTITLSSPDPHDAWSLAWHSTATEILVNCGYTFAGVVPARRRGRLGRWFGTR